MLTHYLEFEGVPRPPDYTEWTTEGNTVAGIQVKQVIEDIARLNARSGQSLIFAFFSAVLLHFGSGRARGNHDTHAARLHVYRSCEARHSLESTRRCAPTRHGQYTDPVHKDSSGIPRSHCLSGLDTLISSADMAFLGLPQNGGQLLEEALLTDSAEMTRSLLLFGCKPSYVNIAKVCMGAARS